MPDKLAQEISANFLGRGEGEMTEEQTGDTIKEALNMIGGDMLSSLDKDGAFKMGIPEPVEENSLAHDMLRGLKGEMLLIETGETHMAVGMKIEN